MKSRSPLVLLALIATVPALPSLAQETAPAPVIAPPINAQIHAVDGTLDETTLGKSAGRLDLNGIPYEKFVNDAGEITLAAHVDSQDPNADVKINKDGVYLFGKARDFLLAQGVVSFGMGFSVVNLPTKAFQYENPSTGAIGPFGQVFDGSPTHDLQTSASFDFTLAFRPWFYRHLNVGMTYNATVSGDYDQNGVVYTDRNGQITSIAGERRSFLSRNAADADFTFFADHNVAVLTKSDKFALAFAAGVFRSNYITENYAGILDEGHGLGFSDWGPSVSARIILPLDRNSGSRTGFTPLVVHYNWGIQGGKSVSVGFLWTFGGK